MTPQYIRTPHLVASTALLFSTPDPERTRGAGLSYQARCLRRNPVQAAGFLVLTGGVDAICRHERTSHARKLLIPHIPSRRTVLG